MGRRDVGEGSGEGVSGEGERGVGVMGGQDGSWIDRASEFIDDHLRLFRTVPWVLGGLGALLVFRHSTVLRRYHSAASLPKHLLISNARVSGVAAKAHWDSIGVWHVPSARRLLQWKHRPPNQCPPEELVRVGFAGVAIAVPKEAEQWLWGEVVGRRVRCVLLSRTADERMVMAVVHTKRKGFFRGRVCVNEELISRGLAAIDDAQGFSSTRAHTDFMTSLLKRERAAKSRGVGTWEGSEYEGRGRRMLRRLLRWRQ